ncbi:hypothetical protein NDU88_000241 [Pleurodeles waltl]|uniref:Uncharacterized protein n=1 Tax=Pleurodeles waltl TaxID=8319 RepID=A0AAV7TEW1_PLEWA|nr:hypothetical protein NDU88_000241 [Pleurodeles waltl]
MRPSRTRVFPQLLTMLWGKERTSLPGRPGLLCCYLLTRPSRDACVSIAADDAFGERKNFTSRPPWAPLLLLIDAPLARDADACVKRPGAPGQDGHVYARMRQGWAQSLC